MGHRILLLVFVLFISIGTHAQRDPRVPNIPEMDSTYESESEKIERQSRDLRNLGIRRTQDRFPPNLLGMYRKPSKEDLEILKPSQNVLDKYAGFLKQPDSGIFKLNADGRCAQNTETVSGDETCSNYKIPGGGTSFSFRYKSHRIPRLADLILESNILKTFAAMQQGAMVNLGDVPLESVSLQSKGLRYLIDLELVSDESDLAKTEELLGKGITADGFVYGLGFYVKENMTFALRSVAYEGKLMKSLNGIVYDEFKFDKRKDVLIAFRIVEKEGNGNVTIAWKELSRRDSPVLKTNKQLPPIQK